MKTIYLLLLITLSVLTISCSEQGAPDPVVEEDIINTKDTISVQRFRTWKATWEKHGEMYKDTAALFQYFTIPTLDFTEVLAENAKKGKFYFGLEPYREGYTMKFMLVGIDAKGNELVDYSKGNYIYDLSRLCPPFCN